LTVDIDDGTEPDTQANKGLMIHVANPFTSRSLTFFSPCIRFTISWDPPFRVLSAFIFFYFIFGKTGG
jgi:hypothetical protein